MPASKLQQLRKQIDKATRGGSGVDGGGARGGGGRGGGLVCGRCGTIFKEFC